MDSLAGRLLISKPILDDPNFDGTISLLLEHGPDGALGIVLNRPSDLTIADAFPEWSELSAAPGVIFAGGPVERNGLIVLASGPVAPTEADLDFSQITVADFADADLSEMALPLGLRTCDLDSQPALARAEGIEQIRAFAGYAGWGAGQLEGELASGAWWLAEAFVTDVFTRDPSNLWPTVLRRNGGEMAWYAHVPDDPSLN